MPDDRDSWVPWQVAAVDALDVGIALFVSGQVVAQVNPAAARLLRLSGDGLLPQTVAHHGFEVMDEGGRPVPPSRWASTIALTQRIEARGIVELRWRDAPSRRVVWHAAPVTHDGADAAVVTFRDISAGQATPLAPPIEHDASDRQAWLRLVDDTPALVHVTDPNGRVVLANAAFAALVQRERSELIGKSFEELFGEIVGGELSANDGRVLESRRPMTFVEHMPRDGQDRCWASAKAPLRTSDETTYGVVAVSVDISEQAEAFEAAAELAVALEATGDGIGTFDRNLVVTSWNAAAEKLSGFSADEMVGKDVAALAPLALPGDVSRVMATYQAVLGGQVMEREAAHRTASGEEIVLRTMIYPIRDSAGEITGGLVLGRDVSKERAAEADRLRLQQEVDHLQRLESLGQLAGGVAHDFNNLLAVINLTAGMLEARLAEGSVEQRQAQRILAATARGVALTQKMLVFARREPGRGTVVDLNDVVRRADLLLEPTLGERISRSTDLTAEPAMVWGDPVQLEQVVINLAVNARDAFRGGGGTLSIVTRRVDLGEPGLAHLGITAAPGAYVVMSVIDDGPGMDEHTLAHAMEPFFTTKPTGEGTGLGLSMVYGVAARAGGAAIVRSEAGKGTTVDVYFPLVDEPPDPASQRRPPPVGGAGELVLVVEDAAELRALVESVLTEAGYQVVAHAGPHEALVGAPPRAPDLLVSDVVMPGMDGPKLATQLRQRFPDMRVLFMSGYSPEVPLGGSSGDRLLEKPFVADDLLRAVREVLDASPAG